MFISSLFLINCSLEGDLSKRLKVSIVGSREIPIRLTNNVWYNSSMPYFGNRDEIWYSFDVINGGVYNVWWVNEGYGNYTLSIGVNAYYQDGTNIFELGGYGGLIGPRVITASKNGTVLLKAHSWRNWEGTFAIVYSASDTMPDL
jgi:hypothetical protein